MTLIAKLTTYVSFAALALALWLGSYVVTRSPRSQLAWQAGLTLWLLAGIFFDSIISLHPSANFSWWRGWPIGIAIASWYHLSVRLLPQAQARLQRTFPVLAYMAAAIFDILLGLTPWIVTDARSGLGVTIRIYTLGPLFPILPVALLTGLAAILYNFWQARRAALLGAARHQLDSLVRGTLLASVGVVYGVAMALLQTPAPTLPLLIVLGFGIISLGYGIVRYSALVEGRVLRYDFAFSGLLITIVTAVYAFFMASSSMPFALQTSVLALVILTHSGFDFARRALDRLFLRRSERALKSALHNAAIEVGEHEAFKESLRNILAAAVTAVSARWGLITLRDDATFVVHASYHSHSVGDHLPMAGLDVAELTIAPPETGHKIDGLTLIAPLVAEHTSLGAILLGPPRGGPSYGERDLDLIADSADTLAELIQSVWRQEAHADEIGQAVEAFRARERQLQQQIDALSHPPETARLEAAQVVAIEDALRHLHDYSYLGDHPLAAALDHRTTHLDRGKAFHDRLVAAVEKLRPAGAEPREPLPRDWYPYIILRDAYVRGDNNRDIIGKLYVSEATFHRVRRGALRAVSKALFELETLAN